MPPVSEAISNRLSVAIEEVHQLEFVTRAVWHGILHIGTVEYENIDAYVNKAKDDESKWKRKKIVEEGHRQYVSGFQNVTEMAVVYLWSKVDNLIPDLLASHITENPEALNEPSFPKLNLPVGILSMDALERSELVMALLQEKIDTPLKAGVGRFESLLKIFKLGGPVPKKLSDKIYELSNVRNAIVHSNSHADKRLVSNCPHLGYSVGQRLHITPEQYMSYVTAIFSCLCIVVYRFRGEPVPEKFIEEWL